MRSTKRESLLDCMVVRTKGLVEFYLRNGNEEMAVSSVRSAFKQIKEDSPPNEASQIDDDVHVVNTGLSMQTIWSLESVGLLTVGDVRRYDPIKLMSIPLVGRKKAVEILKAVGAVIPDVLLDKKTNPEDYGFNKTRIPNSAVDKK